MRDACWWKELPGWKELQERENTANAGTDGIVRSVPTNRIPNGQEGQQPRPLEEGNPGRSSHASAPDLHPPVHTKFTRKSSIPDNNSYDTPPVQPYREEHDADEDSVRADGERDVNAQDQRQQLRRSARASTSVFKDGGHRRSIPAPDPDPYPSDHVVLEYPMGQPGSVTVTYGDKKRLNDEEFLNDTLIELGLKKAMVDVKKADESRRPEERIAPATHLFNSFFYKKLSSGKQLKEDEDRHDRNEVHKLVDKGTKRFNLFDKKQVLVPINEHLHWYLAVIVNPKWILDAAADHPPPSLAQKQEKAHATSGRTSLAVKEQEAEMVLGSSSQPATPAVDLPTVLDSSRYAANDDEEEEEGREEILERRHQEQEEEIQIGVQERLANTTVGGEDVQDADGDVNMFDANLEGGGGGNKPSNGKTSKLDTLELSGDDEPIVPTTQSPAAPRCEGSAPLPVTASANGSAGRSAVPIGPPTGPPKGASSSPPAASASIDGRGPNANPYENCSASEIAQGLGTDESLADRCWIFTFDSLGGRHDAVVERLKKYINQEAIEKLGVEWTAAWAVQGIPVTVPIQPKFCDCGLYLLHSVEKFLADPELMTKYIVGRNIPWSATEGHSAQAKRIRAELNEIKNHFAVEYEKEDFFNAAEVRGKRRAMRAEVEGLMEAYKPYKEEKDTKERNEKAAKDRRRKEGDRGKGSSKARRAKSASEVGRGQAKGKVDRKECDPSGSTETVNLSSDSNSDDDRLSPTNVSRDACSLASYAPELSTSLNNRKSDSSAPPQKKRRTNPNPSTATSGITSTPSRAFTAHTAHNTDHTNESDDTTRCDRDHASRILDECHACRTTSPKPISSTRSPLHRCSRTRHLTPISPGPLSTVSDRIRAEEAERKVYNIV